VEVEAVEAEVARELGGRVVTVESTMPELGAEAAASSMEVVVAAAAELCTAVLAVKVRVLLLLLPAAGAGPDSRRAMK